jgi:hypothetical protein
VANRLLNAQQGRRTNANALVIVMIGSESQDTDDELLASAEQLRSLGAQVVTVGTNDTAAVSHQMDVLAGSSRNVFTLEDMKTRAGNLSAFQNSVLASFVCNSTSNIFIPTSSSSIAGAQSSVPSTTTQPSSLAVAPSSSTSLAVALPSTSTAGAVPTPLPTFTPFQPLTYCSQFAPTDIVFVISASGQTGATVFAQFVNLASIYAANLLDSNGAVR